MDHILSISRSPLKSPLELLRVHIVFLRIEEYIEYIQCGSNHSEADKMGSGELEVHIYRC